MVSQGDRFDETVEKKEKLEAQSLEAPPLPP